MANENRILFIVERNIYYRHYGPFIDFFLKRNQEVYLIHDYSHPRDGSKAGYFPSLYSSPRFEKQCKLISIYSSKNELVEFINSHDINFTFSLMSLNHYNIKKLEVPRTKWVLLQHWADNFQHGSSELCDSDIFLSYSKLWWDSFVMSKYNNIPDSLISLDVYHVGHPLNFLINSLSVKNIRDKYGLYQDKKVLVYLPIGPPKMYNFTSIFQKIWLAYYYSSLSNKVINRFLKLFFAFNKKLHFDEEDILRSIRDFCNHNNYYFIVKTRSKSIHSQYLIDTADYVFYDESFYPPTISELLFISDITVSHFSMSTFEAVAMKSYIININLEPVFNIFTNHFSCLFGSKWLKDFNTNGISQIITKNEFVNSFGEMNESHFRFSMEKYNIFMNKYFSGVKSHYFYSILNNFINK
jgi:hypothetical protein